MFLYALMMLEEERLTFTEAITPYLPLIGIVVGGIVMGLFGAWNRKRGATETRAPDVNESWNRAEALDLALDNERKTRRLLQDLLYDVLAAFHSYTHRVQRGGSTDLTTREQKAHDTKVP